MDTCSVDAFFCKMTYSEFLKYIYQRYSGNVKLGLERIYGILTDMGNPQDKLKGIHVAGTNGKGSVCATCEALALAHGLHTGLNTSPHLIDYCERFRIDGQNAAFSEVLELFHRLESIFTKWDASFFEITTAIAFQMLAEKHIQTAVIEVGLGGRLDATNLFTPEVSIITTIGLDHVKTLGSTMEKIAFEKAGIIKQEIPLVIGKIESSPLQVILEQAASKQAAVIRYNEDFTVDDIQLTQSGTVFSYKFRHYQFDCLQSNLLGRHQAVNISTALTAWLIYCERIGIIPDEQRIRFALSNINWMGRMQVLKSNPTVIVDGAHNLQGVQTFAKNLKELFPNRKLLFVVSILADKDYKRMLKALAPLAACFYISKNESDRAAEIDAQAKVVVALGCDCKTAPTVKEAFRLALSDANKDDIVIGAGSLYTVAEIISAG
jgi:dihydrofolate synthase/folylpolyglutamate synthase